MKHLIAALLLLITLTSSAQIQLSNDATVSLLTIGPGAHLNDSFGHTAFRIQAPRLGIDVVYNYGVYDFDTPNFYTKFAQGKLNYKIGRNAYENFFGAYKAQNRSITEQILDLDTLETQELFEFLEDNYKPENRYYLYDFFYDNCATRPVAAMYKVLANDLKLTYDHQPEGLSHRDLIRQHVSWNSWGGLGIDIALGSVIDRPAQPREYLFLPNYVQYAFAKAQLETSTSKRPLVSQTNVLFSPTTPPEKKTNFFLSPLFIIGLLSIFLLYKTARDFKSRQGITKLDTAILFFSGLIGILLLLLWFATDHTATKWNYNLLWAFPFHLLAAFVVTKRDPPQWILPYMKLAVIMMALLFFHWIIGVQRYAIALLPLLVAITTRYVYILRGLRAMRDSATIENS